MKVDKPAVLGAVLLLTLLLAGCRPLAALPSDRQADGAPTAADALRNATYTGILPGQLVTLTVGSANYEEEGPGTPFVQLLDQLIATGDLDGDGVEDAVGLLVDYTTGSADFVYLAALLSTQPGPVEAIQIGDRTPVKALAIVDDQVIVDYVGPGPSDAACCPAWNVRKVFSVEAGRLVERSREEAGEVSLDDLNGTRWRLVELGADQQPVLPEPEITLFFDGGRISGSAGCNDYTGAVSAPEELPQSFAVGPLAVTASLCEDPIAGQESTYLDLLGKAVAWRYAFGQLALTYRLEGDVLGELLFAPLAAPLAAPSAAQAGDANVAGTLTAQPWQWVTFTSPVEQFDVATPERYRLTFNEDGIVDIVADCNTAIGSYKIESLDGGSLAIDVAPKTTALCPPESRGDKFMSLLGGTARYFFQDGKLFIDLMADGGTMQFDPAGATSASGEADVAALEAMVAGIVTNPWKWTSFSSIDEAVTVEEPASYMVTFKVDGTIEIKADCNNASGTYTLDGANITIEVGPSTLARCPGESRSEQFLQLLGDTASVLPLGNQLFAPSKIEGSTMILEAVLTTVVDLCGEQALAINTIEDTLAPEISAMLDQGLVSLVQGGARPGPGASMLIITPEGRYFKSTGVADVTTCAPLAADSPYQIGSNTKMMTSAILFQLQEEGVLSTADPLSKWLPALAAQLPYGDQITIDMLLTHTSGLHDYFAVPTADGKTIADGEKDKAMLTRGFTPEELVTLVAGSGLSDFEPGAEGQWNYSNTGYMLLGLIIEQATGKSYAENLNARILEPLDLTQTYLQTGPPEPGALPQAYFKSPFDFTTSEWNASQGWSAGAVVSTPDEFAVFLKALFTGRLFNDSATLDRMKEHTGAGVDALAPGTIYAHGMFDNNGVLGHGGQTLGFQSDGGYIPDQDVTIVIWSNAAESNVAREIVPAIAGVVVGGDLTGQSEQTGQGALPRFEPLDECFAQQPDDLAVKFDIDCGYVVVPESRSGASDGEVKLGFTRLNSGQGTANSPLLMLYGGPGQAVVSPEVFNLFQPELLGGILDARDIILVEQRGTEHSNPFLNCPEILSADWVAYEQDMTDEEAQTFATGAITNCIERFKAEGVDFDAYNSVENAADVNAVRAALGYDKIIYYGASYGSQLGQHVMRDFPEILEAVVLDGAATLERKSWSEDRALDAQWGIDNLTKLCEADAKCKEAYDIPALVDAALALFDNGPLPYSYTDPNDPSLTVDGAVTVDDMVNFIYGNQGSLAGIAGLPSYLNGLVEGGAEAVAEFLGAQKASNLLASRTATTSPLTLLMHMAMVCSDDPVKSVDEVRLDGAGRYATLFGQGGAAGYVQYCSLIAVRELPDSTDVDVTTDVPTLLLSGDLDVATPTFRSQEVADALPNASLVVFPGRTHVQIAGVNLCAGQIMTQFVLDPTAPLDTGCVAEALIVGFVLPDGTFSKEEE